MNKRLLCLIAALGTLLLGVSRAVASPGGLEVLPFPGTPDASPGTQIDFPAVEVSQLRRVTVTASISGAHPGRLQALAGHGSAFYPSRPFVNGDRVTVRTLLASGRRFAYSFTVAAPVHDRIVHGAINPVHQAINPAAFTRTFHSAPNLHPPVVVTNGRDPDPAAGDIFLDAQRSIQAGPLILDPQGRPVWFDPLSGSDAATDLAVQQYQGRSVLTFWEGAISGGVGQGYDVIMDHSYQTIATVHAANGYQTDLHEFEITPQGNALVDIYTPVHADLRSVGGPANGVLLDNIVQEINISTGRLLWEWHAYGHVHIAESYAGRPGTAPYDFFHINSIQQLPDGDFLISARHTFAVYDINPATGRIRWILGGKHSSFKVGPGANFEWQHDARLYGWTLTVFDDGAGYRRSESQSRALEIWLHPNSMRATLTRAFTHTPPVLSDSEGNMQVLPDHNVFVGFGSNPYFAEYSPTGRQLFSDRFAYPVEFYRAYRFPWYGYPPLSNLAAAATPTANGTTVYASWNGATQIATWRVLAGPTPRSLSVVAQRPYNGFETGIATSSTAPYFAVQALDAGGQVLGTSQAVPR